ncbi:hypothetical protein [Aeromonas caviae]|jgi:hypothetical protein|uniref:hypothetical protein n=1 Tax=Aeromonas caviae TaxID=648 RepID=UPI0038D1D55C
MEDTPRSNARLLCLNHSLLYDKGAIYEAYAETDLYWFLSRHNNVDTVRKSDGVQVGYNYEPLTAPFTCSFALVDSEMKDKHDTQTQDLISAKRTRGRPVTGKALTPAEKQAAYRARKAQKSVTVTFNRDAIEALDMHIRALASGHDVSIDPDKLKSILESIRSATQSQLVSEAV